VILSGGGIRKKERGYPMSVVDLAPTIAYLLGTPIPKDAEGNVLKEFL
jgi:arylsulfatase A-like enzyme